MAADAAAKVAGAPQTGNVANVVRTAVSDAVKTHMPSLLSAPAKTAGGARENGSGAETRSSSWESSRMPSFSFASTMLQQEARGLLTRLARVRPFVLVEPMLTAAAPLPHTQSAIDGYLIQGRKRLLNQVHEYLRWLESEQGQAASPETAQRRFTLLKLRFNAVVTQFDMFSNAITQRSENEFGVWLAGLDVVAADALALPPYFDSPPVLCYLDKGIGAAIRRARTRLPGGGDNPVALVRMPRERMIGSGIASSLVHEVGHQAAALLDLVAGSVRRSSGGPPTSGWASIGRAGYRRSLPIFGRSPA